MASDEFKNYRQRIIENLEILSSTDEQVSYQKQVSQVNVPDELLCKWFDDLDMPSSLVAGSQYLTEYEIEAIKRFSEKFDKVGELIRKPNEIGLNELLKHDGWQHLVLDAASLLNELKKKSR